MGSLKTVNISNQAPYVDPFTIQAGAGDEIKVVTGANAAAAISIPDAFTFLVEAEKEGYSQVYIPAESYRIFTVKSDPETGTHYYHVFMQAQDEFADNPGSSAPKIVIS